jgi:hypothetical protein
MYYSMCLFSVYTILQLVVLIDRKSVGEESETDLVIVLS